MNGHTVRRKYTYKREFKAFMQNYRPNYKNDTNLRTFILHYFYRKKYKILKSIWNKDFFKHT